MDFKGQTALVTGAARGIGQAIGERLAVCGARVVICDIVIDAAEKTAAELKERGLDAIARRADVSNAGDVKKLIDDITAEYKTLDIVVNNAGITRDKLMIRMTEEEWNLVIDINLKGAFLVTQASGRVMMKQRSGRIINIASVIGQMGNAGQANYAASKGGLIALTKTAAKELAARGITVNAIAPGFVETEMTRALPEDVQEAYKSVIPLKKFGKPEDIAAAVAFLASADASYVTGQVLGVNGGMYM